MVLLESSITCEASKSAEECSVMLWSGGNQCQQQLQQQLTLQRQGLVTHHNVQHLLQVLAVYLRCTTTLCDTRE